MSPLFSNKENAMPCGCIFSMGFFPESPTSFRASWKRACVRYRLAEFPTGKRKKKALTIRPRMPDTKYTSHIVSKLVSLEMLSLIKTNNQIGLTS